MGLELPERTVWGERALQGLAFWIGHREALFSNYPLPEAALVAEACNLLSANLRQDHLECEVMYRKLLPAQAQRTVLGELDRVDLAITSASLAGVADADVASLVKYIIEVKRVQSSKTLVDRDLKRVHEALVLSNSAYRGLLFMVSQSKIPTQFVTKSGGSKKGPHKIDGTTGWYVVRRTCKASSSFEKPATAHYACLIEVFTHQPQPTD